MWLDGLWGRRPVAERTMGSDPVVGLPPAFNDHLRFPAGVEAFPIRQLVAQLAIEALDIAVLLRASWFERQRPHPLHS